MLCLLPKLFLSRTQFWGDKNFHLFLHPRNFLSEGPLFLKESCLFFNLSRLYTQHGAWTTVPEIKSHTLYHQSQPGAPEDSSLFWGLLTSTKLLEKLQGATKTSLKLYRVCISILCTLSSEERADIPKGCVTPQQIKNHPTCNGPHTMIIWFWSVRKFSS